MRHLFYDEVVYECDLGGMNLTDFLPSKWLAKKQFWNPIDNIKDFTHNYYLRKKFSENHIIIKPRLEKESPNIVLEYFSNKKKIQIQMTPSTALYFHCFFPVAITLFLYISGVSLIGYLIPFSLLILFLLIYYYSYQNALQTIKHDLELEFRFQKIKYAIRSGETYYPTS